jgi:hypothetical protein
MPKDDPAPELSEDARRLLAAVLRLSPADAERIRDGTPPRRRPSRQVGPTADYGDPDN